MGRSILREYFILMHFPLPLIVLSISTIGASLAPRVHLDRLVLSYLAIFSGLCLSAYSFDELRSRPWKTSIPSRLLWSVGLFGMVVVTAIGIYLTLIVGWPLLLILGAVLFFILAYNMELFGGKFHNAVAFSLSWGGLTCIGSYYVQVGSLSLQAVAVAILMTLFSSTIWLLIHEARLQFDPAQFPSESHDRVLAIRRRFRHKIWMIIKLQTLTIFLTSILLLWEKLS